MWGITLLFHLTLEKKKELISVPSFFCLFIIKRAFMNDYPLEKSQLMLVRPNSFGLYSRYAHFVVCLIEVASTDKGIIAKCYYVDDDHKIHEISIPLFLLWRIADDEDLLEMHEQYIHSKCL